MIYNKILERYEGVLQTLIDFDAYWQKEKLAGTLNRVLHKTAEEEVYERFSHLLESKFPEDGLIVEDFAGKEQKNEYIWVLDPIDGTSNMCTGVSFFSVAISLVAHESDFLLSFVADLNFREIHISYGEENRKYSLKSKTCEVLDHLEDTRMEKQEYILIGRIFGHLHSNKMEEFRNPWWNLAVSSKSYRQLGSIALQMILDGLRRNIICFSLGVRWFDIVAPLHFLKNLGYTFQISTNQECLIVYHPKILPCQALEEIITVAKKNWRFSPSNTLNISR